jgi:hypothetical protein
VVICFGQFFESLRINAVLDLGTIDTKKYDLRAALYGLLCSGTERYVVKRYGWGVSLLCCILSTSEVGQSAKHGSAAKCRPGRNFQTNHSISISFRLIGSCATPVRRQKVLTM